MRRAPFAAKEQSTLSAGGHMLTSFPIILLVVACFFALALNLAIQSRLKKTIIKICIIAAFCIGSVLYGYGYTCMYGLGPVAFIRALFSLCKMFAGVYDLSFIEKAPRFQSNWILSVFWIGHFLAFYATASAAIAALGESLLRNIRIRLLRRGPLLLIYGIHSDSVAYGRHMAEEKQCSVLYVGENCDTSLRDAVYSFGAGVDLSPDALNPSSSFLRRFGIRPGRRRLETAVLGSDERQNLIYARALLSALSEAGILPDQTSLVIACSGSDAYALQAMPGQYGYGSVYSFDTYSVTARLITLQIPPCSYISFLPNGRAAEDYHIVIAGFGKMGYAVLEQAVMNGQFAGSRFRADIFDPNPQNGFLYGNEMISRYDIRFQTCNIRSEAFYTFLSENRNTIRCIFLCLGNSEINQEIASDLKNWYRTRQPMPPVVMAVPGRLTFRRSANSDPVDCEVYTGSALALDQMDAMAMQIHHRYCSDGNTPEEDWNRCDPFSRLSNRASADFYPAVLKASGETEEEILSGKWPPSPEILENLAITEHLRWCAFHTVMGYSPMPEDVYQERIRMYQKEKEQTGHSSIRIGKDSEQRLHACLIPWDSLDTLSERENSVTGGTVDYKELDRRTVLTVRDVLMALEDLRKGTVHE